MGGEFKLLKQLYMKKHEFATKKSGALKRHLNIEI